MTEKSLVKVRTKISDFLDVIYKACDEMKEQWTPPLDVVLLQWGD